MMFTDEQGREVDVSIEFNGEGEAYYADATYTDDGSQCSDEVLAYLEDTYSEYLYDCVIDRHIDQMDSYFEDGR